MAYMAEKNTGKMISQLRKKAGYTQKVLADALQITDKAVSKWERGLSLPDVTLLPKLSALLDADIELLLQESGSGLHQEWNGVIDLRKYDRDLAQILYDKPMVYYILAHFLLLNIKDIYILGDSEKQSWIGWERLQEMGFCFTVNPKDLPKKNLMIMPHPCFLFGSDLTRRFQAAMSTRNTTKLCPQWDITPFLFCPEEHAFMYLRKPTQLFDCATRKTLGRGMVCLPMDTMDQINDIASFVRIYQASTGLKLEDIAEIASCKNKG